MPAPQCFFMAAPDLAQPLKLCATRTQPQKAAGKWPRARHRQRSCRRTKQQGHSAVWQGLKAAPQGGDGPAAEGGALLPLRGPGPRRPGLPAAAAPKPNLAAASGLHRDGNRERTLTLAKPSGPETQCLPISSPGPAVGRALEMRGVINGQPARILLDCGATNDFMSEAFARQHGMQVQGKPSSHEVALADGSVQPSGRYVEARIRMKAYRCKRRLLLLGLPQVDAILGMIWLAAANPILDFAARTCELHTAKGPVVLHAEDWEAPA